MSILELIAATLGAIAVILGTVGSAAFAVAVYRVEKKPLENKRYRY